MFNFNNQNRNFGNKNIEQNNNCNQNFNRESDNLQINVKDNLGSQSGNNTQENTYINSKNYYNNQNLKMANSSNIISFEALQKARQDLIGELDAIIEYDNHIHTSNVDIAKETWEDIRNEELVHMGELLALIIHLAPYQKEFIEKGVGEFEERLQNLKK